jgi:hypothetical protein
MAHDVTEPVASHVHAPPRCDDRDDGAPISSLT